MSFIRSCFLATSLLSLAGNPARATDKCPLSAELMSDLLKQGFEIKASMVEPTDWFLLAQLCLGKALVSPAPDRNGIQNRTALFLQRGVAAYFCSPTFSPLELQQKDNTRSWGTKYVLGDEVLCVKVAQ